MPAWGTPHQAASDDDPWKLVAYIRTLKPLNASEKAMQSVAMSAHYVGSKSCQKCHAEIYEHWQKTPMANVVRDPKEHPEAIIPNLATNNVAKFTVDQVALVYGSIWKQRYFTKVGDDLFPLDAQWDVGNKVWRPYLVKPAAAWWAKYYGPDESRSSDRPDVRRVPFRELRHSHEAADWSGTSAANAVTDPEASMSRIRCAARC